MNQLCWVQWFIAGIINASKRPQYVQTKLERSGTLTLSTGAPQGCALSANLFVLYTNDLQSDSEETCIIKYADDTVVVGLISGDDNSKYFECTKMYFKSRKLVWHQPSVSQY